MTADGSYWHPVAATDDRAPMTRQIEPLGRVLDHASRPFASNGPGQRCRLVVSLRLIGRLSADRLGSDGKYYGMLTTRRCSRRAAAVMVSIGCIGTAPTSI